MDTAILPSTLLLTLLLSVGLFFFIRASTKDRIQKAQFVSALDEATFMQQLQEYFRTRSYQVVAVDPEENQVTFEGFVNPSWFLAVFLTLLSAVGFLCLALVLSLLFPQLNIVFLGLVLLSPLSGLFYWKKSARFEKVLLKVEATQNELRDLSQITVIAHRDEINELQKTLKLNLYE